VQTSVTGVEAVVEVETVMELEVVMGLVAVVAIEALTELEDVMVLEAVSGKYKERKAGSYSIAERNADCCVTCLEAADNCSS
jgi:hypothetical protein